MKRKKSRAMKLGLCTTTVVLATTFLVPFSSTGVAAAGAVSTVGAFSTVGAAVPVRTDLQVASMAPAAQAALLNPLRAIANAVYGVRNSAGPGVFKEVSIDANHNLVHIWLTNTTRGPSVIQAAKSAHPSINTSLIRVHTYVRPGPVKVPGMPLRSAHKNDAWNKVKWHDHAPFIGGDAITRGAAGHCTLGLPAVRKSDGRQVMVTAAHCAPKVGMKVYTRAGTPGDFSNKVLGDFVGTATKVNRTWDAVLLVGASNNADESDVNTWVPLTSVAYSFRGDYVCHSGARSAFLGHSSPCGIKVTKANTTWRMGGFLTRGVEGVDVSANHWGCVGGDSGATVWASTGNPNARQARGIISDGDPDGTVGQKVVRWTEAVDIFNAFGLKLNPKT